MSARKRSCDRLEPLRRQYEVDLVVCLPTWSMPGRWSELFLLVQRVDLVKLMASNELESTSLMSLVSPIPDLHSAPDHSL
ncbi:hypothetical protein DPMN_100003 [Dreissena polymorpha]|uniref:Uncharacterized protein n=1 Tax=Dreissena polymorpha TaxID=45954 RepID=A0A9D4LIC5_DREPO|nr:hypothetical protein DPMN_103612 [Dreissena polymorpha]KAH3857396.1 hypothetical protein DPMN_100003 [Dreissena polymorpha]